MAESFRELQSTNYYNGLGVTLRARLVLYSSSSFIQINDVTRAWWTTGGGPHSLSASNADWLPTEFPASSVTITGSTTISVPVEVGAEAGFEAAGFTLSASASGTYTGRLTVNDTITFSAY